MLFFLFKQKTAYEMRISDWSSDVCSSDLPVLADIQAGWLEEPFACNDFASYREAAKITPLVPLAAGENHFMRFEFAQMLEAGAVQVWQPDLSKTGGITESRSEEHTSELKSLMRS